MRRLSTLDALFTAPRQGILAATLMQPERWWYLSDLARHLGLHHATLQRELARLSGAEILQTERDGNRVYYRANTGSPVFPDLRALLAKTAGLVGVLHAAVEPFVPKIAVAFVYGSVANGTESSQSDVDLMVIGDVTLKALAPALHKAEKHLRRPINPSLYRPAEFAKKASEANHFVREVLEREKLYVVGTQDELDRLARGRASRAAQAVAGGDRSTTTRR